MDPHILDFLKKQSLMRDFSDEELAKIAILLKKQEFDSLQVIIDEGDISNEVYLIEEGEVKVLKWDQDGVFQLPIGKLISGDMFGEMSFMDDSPRSSTIETVKKTSVYSLSRSDLEKKLPETQGILNKIFFNIATININRLRAANEAHVKSMRSSLRNLQIRNNWGVFNLKLIFLFIIVATIWVLTRVHTPFSNEVIYWFFTVSLLIPTFYLTKQEHFYWDEFHLFHRNLKNTLTETAMILAVSIPVMALLSWTIKMVIPPVVHEIALPFLLLGYLAYVVAQEFIFRGIILSSLEKFLEEENPWVSIIITSVLAVGIGLSLLPYVSVYHISVLFAANLFFGKLYIKHKNIVGVILLHYFLGLYAKYLQII